MLQLYAATTTTTTPCTTSQQQQTRGEAVAVLVLCRFPFGILRKRGLSNVSLRRVCCLLWWCVVNLRHLQNSFLDIFWRNSAPFLVWPEPCCSAQSRGAEREREKGRSCSATGSTPTHAAAVHEATTQRQQEHRPQRVFPAKDNRHHSTKEQRVSGENQARHGFGGGVVRCRVILRRLGCGRRCTQRRLLLNRRVSARFPARHAGRVR